MLKIIHVDDDLSITPQINSWFEMYVDAVSSLANVEAEAERIETHDDENDDEDQIVINWAKLAKVRNIDVKDIIYCPRKSEDEFWETIDTIKSKNSIDVIIILDLKLHRKEKIDQPGGLNILKKIRSDGDYANVPVIILSTHSSRKTVKQCYAMGANAFVKKGRLNDLKNRFFAIITHWNSIVTLPVR